ncbi:MAG: tyrosine-type recombinase/integrase [Thermoanaerobaculia bacterium]
MATIYCRKLPSGRVKWYITHGRGKDRRRLVAGATKEEAQAALRLFKRQLALHGKPPGAVTSAEAVASYRQHLELHRSAATVRRYSRILKTFFEAFLAQFHPGAGLLRDLKPLHLEDFKRRRLAGEIQESPAREALERDEELRSELDAKPQTKTPKANAKYGVLGGKRLQKTVTKRTINYELQCLSTFFQWAIRQNHLFTNPAEGIERFRIPKRSLPKFLRRSELEKFFAACSPEERRLFSTLLLTGMRKGELEHLEWSDVSFELGLIFIRAKIDWQPKTDERIIPISPVLARILYEHQESRRSDRWVFANRNGNRETHLLEKVKKICRKAGIRPATVHALRHSFGAHLRMQGVRLADIADLMGHKDLATTQIYAKVQIEHLRTAVERLGPLVTDLEGASPEATIASQGRTDRQLPDRAERPQSADRSKRR